MRPIRALPLCLALFAGCALPAATPGVNAKQHTVYATVQSFRWEESLPGEGTVVEETGPLFGVGYRYDGARARARAELYGGSVDYDGQTQAGDPIQSDTDYLGTLIEGDWKFLPPPTEGLDFAFPRRAFEPYIGGGMHFWTRGLGAPPGGISYDENWFSLYVHAGFEASKWFDESRRLFFGARLGVTLYTDERVDFGFAAVDLNPEPGPMFRLEGGWEHHALHLLLFVDYAQWGESDPEQGIYQPESEVLRIGLNGGFRW